MIPASWMTARPGDNPLHVLDRLLGEQGRDIDGAFADFAARCAALDFAHPELYQDAVERTRVLYPDYDTQVAGEVDTDGTGGWVDAAPATLPEAWGFNVIRMDAPAEGALAVAIEGDAAGSEGTQAVLRARIVQQRSDGATYDEIDIDRTTGTATIGVAADVEALSVVVTAQPETTTEAETFAYRYRMTYDAKADDPGQPAGGCQVAAPGSRGSLLAGAVAAALALARRRRRTRRAGDFG
jgi:hypothetical protein